MKEYLNTKEDFKYVQDVSKRFSYWMEIPEGAEVLTGLRNDKFSLVFWKPSVGEVWKDNMFAKYVIQKSISFEEYVDRCKSDPVLWKRDCINDGSNDMKEQYVIKTRNDKDEYLAYCSHEDKYYLNSLLQFSEKYDSIEDAHKRMGVQVLKESKYKCDIYKIVQALEYVDRGV